MVEVIAVEHQKFQPLQPRQGPVIDPANAVEPTRPQKMCINDILMNINWHFYIHSYVLTCIPLPKVYAMCVCR